MDKKTIKIQNATNKIKQRIVLYHVLSPINQQQFNQIKESGYFKPSENALGGQSNGYYFFTTRQGAQYHIDSNKDMWEKGADKNAYIVECEIDRDDVKYPIWKLDYEAMQDFLFDMIYMVAQKHSINFDGLEIKVANDKKLEISDNGKFSRISSFSADIHSGLVERIADYLYKNNSNFKNAYDKLLQDVFAGNGNNQELYAVKTSKKQKITNITKIEIKTPEQQPQNSQINKFFARYGRTRR